MAVVLHNLLFLIFTVGDSVDCQPSIELMEAEAALYWRTVCKHLQSIAQVSQKEYPFFIFIYLFICLSAIQERIGGRIYLT